MGEGALGRGSSAFIGLFLVLGLIMPRAEARLSNGSVEEQFPEVAIYADAYNVSLAEAEEQLSLQQAVGRLEGELTTKESESFGGAWITHEPQFKVIALFTSGGEETLRHYVDGNQPAGLVEARPAKYTLAELEDQQTRVMQLHFSLSGTRDFESRINLKANRVEVLTATPEAYEVMTSVQPSLPESVTIIQVAALSEAMANIYGGLTLSNGCTTGFTVERNAGTKRGISTAGHCPNTTSHAYTNLPWQNGSWVGDTDAQWHTTPGFTTKNWVKDDSGDAQTPGYRNILSRTPRHQQTVGSMLCKYGRTTGFHCGELIDKNFDPSDACVPSSTKYMDAGTSRQRVLQ